MSDKKIISLKEFQRAAKVKQEDLYQRIKDERLPLYIPVPESRVVLIASSKYLDLLIGNASPEELKWYALRGGSDDIEPAPEVAWLSIPIDQYQTLFSSGMCRPRYFSDGLHPTENGLEIALPKFKNTKPYSALVAKRLPLQPFMAYFISQPQSPYPVPLPTVAVDDVYACEIALKSLFRSRPTSQIARKELPACKNPSQKLLIAFEVWTKVWRKDFEVLNSKTHTEKESIVKRHKDAIELAKNLLNEYKVKNNIKEKFSELPEAMAKLIRPNDAESEEFWFKAPISDGIEAMAAATNYFWSDPDVKDYGSDFCREEVKDYFMKEHILNATDAHHATMIIQPDHIKRGRRKSE